MPDVDFRLPHFTDRTAIVGRTGTGKSTLAAWILSHSDFDKRPWVIIDYKRDEIFQAIEDGDKDAITEIEPNENAPRKPGLYIMRPIPVSEDHQVNQFLWKIWDREKTGLWIDEAHLMPSSDAMKALLVTGRSLKIPMIVISQRPVWVPREVFSESNHQVAFDLNRRDDRKLVGEFMTNRGNEIPRFPNHHSLWHDVGRNVRFKMQPAPHGKASVQAILQRAPRRFRWL